MYKMPSAFTSNYHGSHVRLKHPGPPEHHLTVPLHAVLKVGLLNGVLTSAASHLGISKQDLAKDL